VEWIGLDGDREVVAEGKEVGDWAHKQGRERTHKVRGRTHEGADESAFFLHFVLFSSREGLKNKKN
jgi:hypothetical protein